MLWWLWSWKCLRKVFLNMKTWDGFSCAEMQVDYWICIIEVLGIFWGQHIHILAPDPRCVSKNRIKQMHCKSADMSNITHSCLSVWRISALVFNIWIFAYTTLVFLFKNEVYLIYNIWVWYCSSTFLVLKTLVLMRLTLKLELNGGRFWGKTGMCGGSVLCLFLLVVIFCVFFF